MDFFPCFFWVHIEKEQSWLDRFPLIQKRSRRKEKITKGKAPAGNVRKEVSRNCSFVNKEKKDT